MIVYLLRNKQNGKCYIGKSTRPLWHRWSQHKAEAKLGRVKSPLYDAIREAGADAFEATVLIEAESSRRAAQLERRFIREFDAVENGYNLSAASHGPRRLYRTKEYQITPEHRRKINESLRRSMAEKRKREC